MSLYPQAPPDRRKTAEEKLIKLTAAANTAARFMREEAQGFGSIADRWVRAAEALEKAIAGEGT